MLVIKRKGEEAITIAPVDGIDLTQTLGDLFAKGPIEITVFDVGNNAVKVAIEAPPQLKIWRGHRPPTSGKTAA